jgi:hypothetical protein
MSFLQALDATAIASRSSAALADPAAWAMGAPVVTRPKAAAPARDRYSWWTLARNPHALVVTGMVGALMARDALLRTVAAA